MQILKRIIPLLLTLVLLGLASPTPVQGQLEPEDLASCAEYAFSVEEDFVTQGPLPPDENPVISDGDLLGLVFDTETVQCAICARNVDLLVPFDVRDDLGLDAVDVLDVDDYYVAFSTELDSPNLGQFTAGDLLVTNGTVIPNEALTYTFSPGLPDIGLDAVHFTGGKAAILDFMATTKQISRSDWLQQLDLLATLLTSSGIDIWYSTEGDVPGLQDGDLVSAKTGAIVASQDALFLPGVPAGLPTGVDFGLDAVTSDRGTDISAIHFSTEILYEEDPSFSDGDVLKIGEGVVATNWEHIACFEPVEQGKDFGLDALSINTSGDDVCVSRITQVSGVPVGDLGLDGLVVPNTIAGVDAPVPFGGHIELEGALCEDVETFRVVYRLHGSSDPWKPIGVNAGKNWTVKVDAFIPPYPDCLGTQGWYSDSSGWFDGTDYRHLTLPALGGCNPGLALTIWESAAAVDGPDQLYELQLETTSTGGSITGDPIPLQLDNTDPTVELQKSAGVCSSIDGSEMPYTVMARMQDDHFYRYQLQIAGDGYGIYHYTPVTYYDDLTDHVIETGTTSWNAFVGLHEINIADLVVNPTSCGFLVRLDGWDRTRDCDFDYMANFSSCCTACRHMDDMWVFNFSP